MRILFLAASPDDKARLRLDKEHNTIRDRLNEVRAPSVELTLESRWAVRPEDLSGALLDVEPDIVHFAGHGERDGIYLENDHGDAIAVRSDTLAETLAIAGKNVRCVVLNACHTADHAEAIAATVGTVVGTTTEITDDAAIAFAAGFYRGLSRDLDTEAAFRLGKNEIDLRGLGEHQTPQLRVGRGAARPIREPHPLEPSAASGSGSEMNVYVSKPSAMTDGQEHLWLEIRDLLPQYGVRYRCLGDTDHGLKSPLVDVVDLMRQCEGAMVLGFSQLAAREAVHRDGTKKREELHDVRLPTPWNHMEASMAYALGLPLFIVRERSVREEGVLDRGSLPLYIPATDLTPGWTATPEFLERFKFWLGEVRHQAGRQVGSSSS